MPDKYTREEMDSILGRAIEESDQGVRSQRFDHETLVEAAREVGVPREAVEGAAREVKEERARGEGGRAKPPAGPSRSWHRPQTWPVTLKVGAAAFLLATVYSVGWWLPSRVSTTSCVSWRQTGRCSAGGPREPQHDQACGTKIISGWSGFCECSRGASVIANCGHAVSTCEEACRRGSWAP
jgi:hypothetical protein